MRVRAAFIPLFVTFAVAACSLNPQVEPMPGLTETNGGGSSGLPIFSGGGQGGAGYAGNWQVPSAGAGGFTQGAGGASSQGGAYSGTGGFPGGGSDAGAPTPPTSDSGPDAPVDGGTDGGIDGSGGAPSSDAGRRKDARTD